MAALDFYVFGIPSNLYSRNAGKRDLLTGLDTVYKTPAKGRENLLCTGLFLRGLFYLVVHLPSLKYGKIASFTLLLSPAGRLCPG